VQARVLGVVLNNIARTSRGYYYYNQYNYYYAASEDTGKTSPRKAEAPANSSPEAPKPATKPNRGAAAMLLVAKPETNGAYTLRKEKTS
jgi:hypothetical protein